MAKKGPKSALSFEPIFPLRPGCLGLLEAREAETTRVDRAGWEAQPNPTNTVKRCKHSKQQGSVWFWFLHSVRMKNVKTVTRLNKHRSKCASHKNAFCFVFLRATTSSSKRALLLVWARQHEAATTVHMHMSTQVWATSFTLGGKSVARSMLLS